MINVYTYDEKKYIIKERLNKEAGGRQIFTISVINLHLHNWHKTQWACLPLVHSLQRADGYIWG